jgi:hypothetical protein
MAYTSSQSCARLAAFTDDISLKLPVLCNPHLDDGTGGATASER